MIRTRSGVVVTTVPPITSLDDVSWQQVLILMEMIEIDDLEGFKHILPDETIITLASSSTNLKLEVDAQLAIHRPQLIIRHVMHIVENYQFEDYVVGAYSDMKHLGTLIESRSIREQHVLGAIFSRQNVDCDLVMDMLGGIDDDNSINVTRLLLQLIEDGSGIGVIEILLKHNIQVDDWTRIAYEMLSRDVLFWDDHIERCFSPSRTPPRALWDRTLAESASRDQPITPEMIAFIARHGVQVEASTLTVHFRTVFGEFPNLATLLHQAITDGRHITVGDRGNLIIPLRPTQMAFKGVASQVTSDLPSGGDKL